MDYELIDSGEGEKLERFGAYTLCRPCSQAVWRKGRSRKIWNDATATFKRVEGERWTAKGELPESWEVEVGGIQFRLKTTDFGHLGIFPEQRALWQWIGEKAKSGEKPKVLNLFAYSGGATLAAAKAGAAVTHLDAAKGMVSWARENADLSGLSEAPIRWIVDDVMKFLQREARRERRYDGIILDPPSFGRGAQGQVFKIERDILPLLQMCRELLSENPLFFLLSCHSPGFTPTVLHHLTAQTMDGFEGEIQMGEMVLESPGALAIPSGAFAGWSRR